MIEFNGLKGDVIGVGKKIRRMGGLSFGARLLFEEVLSLPENWQISWASLAKEFKCSKTSIYKWVKELAEKGVWRVENGVITILLFGGDA